MRTTIFLCVISTFFGFSAQQVLKDPPCLNLNAQENFDQSRFVGRWYETGRTPYNKKDENTVCVFYDNDMPVDGDWLISRSWVDSSNNTKYRNIGYGTVDSPGKGLTIEGHNYTILGTDYDNWAVFYTCIDLSYWRRDIIHIKSRDPNKSNDRESILNVLKKNNLENEDITYIRQTDCPTDWSDATVIDDTMEEEERK